MSVAEVNKPQPPDFELAKRAASGDGGAFEELYRRHYRRVYALTLRMMGNPTEAEDMTQDVFLQLFNKIGMFRGESAFTTWLHRMTVNQVLMHFRKKKAKREEQVEDDPEESNAPHRSAGPRPAHSHSTPRRARTGRRGTSNSHRC